MNSKEKYHVFLQDQILPLYLYPEWLDTTKGKNADWDVIFSYNESGQVQGFWVYVYKRQFVWKKISMPTFTPYMGPRLIYPKDINDYQRISFENKVLEDLIRQLPDFAEVKFKWTRGYENWLPFYWKGFQQQTAYTYIIEDTSNTDLVFQNFKSSLQRQIKKAEKTIQIRSNGRIDNAIKMLKMSLSENQHLIDKTLLEKVHQFTQAQNRGSILEAFDEHNTLLAIICLIWDKEEMLYLYGGYDHQYNNSGAMSLLFWEAVKMANQKGLSFNFEGSMLQGVERFFRSFGTVQKPVFTLSKSKFPYNFRNLF